MGNAEADSCGKAASDQIIKNLQRENALIATAWYDLTSRIQSNHVVLQRRSEMPKSWLGKQRQMVNGRFHSPSTLCPVAGLGRLMGGNCSYSQEMK